MRPPICSHSKPWAWASEPIAWALATPAIADFWPATAGAYCALMRRASASAWALIPRATLGEPSTGAEQDLEEVTEIARDIVVKMNETYGEVLKLPEPEISEEVLRTLPGVGRKTSCCWSPGCSPASMMVPAHPFSNGCSTRNRIALPAC